MQHVLQAAAPPATAAELLGLLAPGDVPALPRAGHALREAAALLLHQAGLPAVPAVAITVGGAGLVPRHPARARLAAAVAAAPRLAARPAPRRQHEHGPAPAHPAQRVPGQ